MHWQIFAALYMAFFSVWKVCSYFSHGVAKKLLKKIKVCYHLPWIKPKNMLFFLETNQWELASKPLALRWLGLQKGCDYLITSYRNESISPWKAIMIPICNSFLSFFFFFFLAIFLLCSVRFSAEMWSRHILTLKSIDFYIEWENKTKPNHNAITA